MFGQTYILIYTHFKWSMYLYRSLDSSFEHNLNITFHISKYTLVFLKLIVKGSGSKTFPILNKK